MRPPLPTLGPPPPRSPWPGVVIASLVIGGVVGGGYWGFKKLRSDGAEETPVEQAVVGAAAPVDAGAQTAAKAPAPVAAPTTAPSPYRRARVDLQGALETALVAEVGGDVGPALAQVVNRALVWWVAMPSGLLRNDVIEVLFEERAGEEPLLHAIRFKSGKNGKTHAAYRFLVEGDTYARFFEPEGLELEHRLKDSPIDDYEQVTSLLRDGRGHKGVDFKAPVGTPVKAPFTATVTRKNWNFRANGNCLELREVGGKGRHALFLHLDELPKGIKVGDRVPRGTVIAASGNSGRSFAPHLHYQLMRDEKRALDPFDSHETYRRSLPNGARAAFEVAMKKFDAQLTSGSESTASGVSGAIP